MPKDDTLGEGFDGHSLELRGGAKEETFTGDDQQNVNPGEPQGGAVVVRGINEDMEALEMRQRGGDMNMSKRDMGLLLSAITNINGNMERMIAGVNGNMEQMREEFTGKLMNVKGNMERNMREEADGVKMEVGKMNERVGGVEGALEKTKGEMERTVQGSTVFAEESDMRTSETQDVEEASSGGECLRETQQQKQQPSQEVGGTSAASAKTENFKLEHSATDSATATVTAIEQGVSGGEVVLSCGVERRDNFSDGGDHQVELKQIFLEERKGQADGVASAQVGLQETMKGEMEAQAGGLTEESKDKDAAPVVTEGDQ